MIYQKINGNFCNLKMSIKFLPQGNIIVEPYVEIKFLSLVVKLPQKLNFRTFGVLMPMKFGGKLL
jgi:hypothetical protein